MRSEQEMFELIVTTAVNDERIRAAILNGSRANPNATHDIFQDFDIIYIVTDVAAFKDNPEWIKHFGDPMIIQMPENMQDPPPGNDGAFAYLMQFMDGNRIDLTLYPLKKLNELERDSLSILILDKDGVIEPFPPPNESDYLPELPTSKAFADCCNEFWWVSTYVAKGLWRKEIPYAKYMLDQVVRDQLMKMLEWMIGIKTGYLRNAGKCGKYFEQYLELELWELLLKTYSDADIENTWNAHFAMCDLFRITSLRVAEHFGFNYPFKDDERVNAYLKHVHSLPADAKEIY